MGSRWKKRGWSAWAMAFALVLQACGSGGPADGAAEVELGTGRASFEAVEDRQEVRLAYGTQGGFHVWVSARASGLAPEETLFHVESEALDAPGASASSNDLMVGLEPSKTDGVYEYVGFRAVQDKPECVVNRETRFRLVLTDKHGVTATDERILVPRPDPDHSPTGTCAPAEE